MARGSTFLNLTVMLRAELNRSVSPAVGVDDLPVLKQHINRSYEALVGAFDWPHLSQYFDRITINAGQRYYNVPATLDSDRISAAVVWWSGMSNPIIRGIGWNDYNVYDPQADQRSSPVQKYDLRWTGSQEQIEVWPLPDSSAQTIQLYGSVKVARLVNDGDICALDDNLVVLHAKAGLVKDEKQMAFARNEANELFADLKSKALQDLPAADLAGGVPNERPWSPIIRVR